jgi:hypothetical protein
MNMKVPRQVGGDQRGLSGHEGMRTQPPAGLMSGLWKCIWAYMLLPFCEWIRPTASKHDWGRARPALNFGGRYHVLRHVWPGRMEIGLSLTLDLGLWTRWAVS